MEREKIEKLAKSIKEKHGVPSLAHLTCVSSTKETVKEKMLNEIGKNNKLILFLFYKKYDIIDSLK